MTDAIAPERLRSFVERVERLVEDRDAINADIREVLSEAKSAGFDVPTIRQMVKDRKLDAQDFQERQALLELYRDALTGTPLGDAAKERAAA